MSIHEHRDNRGVFVELWTLDLLDGDAFAAILLSQLLWWHQTAKDGSSRVTYERNGHRWLVRADDDWQEDCRMTQKQVRRVRSVLLAKGLIEHRRFKVNGAPTSAWRPLFDAIQVAIRPNPELPSEGQFQGSDPQGAVPLPSPPLSKTSDRKTRTSFPEKFLLTDEMRAWARENRPDIDVTFETRQFADYHRAKGDRMLRWDLAWCRWMRNAWVRSRPIAPTPEHPSLKPYVDDFDAAADWERWMRDHDPNWRPVEA